ncbi:pyridoxal phosphate phosphatase PHOSPHO2-like [Actinia tenebrosa]|uniref:Pyridoxal phosphate phosphatase PHOSPHO2-like n=1 Tax=Actinia tenebrosa TaxID=6105 RepID=A0A6P8H6Z0_ACTTE|nr:pyridoxal phosphate phosphatase PHOSPHO2-like [Actinia tenebrosa]XP_031551252.1 pyridoxal phosphate phosphatase PHOSPHO2-like [Actinia tenebrosa]XP_031551253.1 pyridoxal phosphate phosphatase PHOSPHO2-like [Actinia tenebrosa]
MEQPRPRILIVFDFDHTLVNGNTDTWITKLHEPTMAAIKINRKRGLCWTNIMDLVFQQLHEQNYSRQDLEKCLETLKFIEGMKETCEHICDSKIPAIIISDSNTYFIDHLLKRDNLSHVFSHVATNPAQWNENGRLQVTRYHSHGCSFCPKNLCKKEVLTNYVTEQMKENNPFDHIIYVGDGKGDFCPALSLESKDYILAREEYQLLDLLKEQSVKSGVEAQIVPWTSGFQVLDLVKKLCNNFKK